MTALIKCTRCRHQCLESEWVGVRSKKYSGFTVSTCPKCGCRSYYDVQLWRAWCGADGVIQFGAAMPADGPDGSGPILIASGPRAYLEAEVKAVARKAHQPFVWLVPGVPEAIDPIAAVDALGEWIRWCAKSKRRSPVEWSVKGGRK